MRLSDVGVFYIFCARIKSSVVRDHKEWKIFCFQIKGEIFMKILMLTEAMDIGGAETHILALASALVRRGHRVTVASRGGCLVPSLLRAGVGHTVISTDRRDAASIVRLLHELASLCRAGYDVIHAHARYPAAICSRLLGRGGPPLVTTAHWVFHNNRFTRAATVWGDETLAVSEDIKSYLVREYGLSSDRVSVTLNGIDTSHFQVAQSLQLNRVLHVSRLDSDRADAARALISAAPRLARELSGVCISIVGDGDCRAELEMLAERVNCKIGRKCVCLLGARSDVSELLASGGIFVGVSRAALEAAACRLPIILSGNEGYAGILNERNFDREALGNFCCRGSRPIELSRLCDDILRLARDRSETERTAEYCHLRVTCEYSAERMAIDAETVYRRAISERRHAMLCGYFGYGNAGDEASLEGAIPLLHRAGYRSVTVLSKDPRATAKSLGVEAIGRFDLPAIALRLWRRPQLFCLVGGNLLQNVTSDRSLFYYTALLSLAERLGSHAAIVGGGIGELIGRRARARAARTLEKCEHIILRTPDDRREAAALLPSRREFALSCDLAMLVSAAPCERITTQKWFEPLVGRRFVAVALGGGEAKRTGVALTAHTLALAKGICAREDAILLFLPMYPDEDAELCTVAREICGGGLIAPSLPPAELAVLLSLSYIIVGTRLHSAVMAIASGRPAILVGNGVKSAAFDSAVSRAARELGLSSPLLWLREVKSAVIPTALRFIHGQSRSGNASAVADRMRLDAEEAIKVLRRDA